MSPQTGRQLFFAGPHWIPIPTRLLAFAWALVLGAVPTAQSVSWTIDAEHSAAQFAVRHMLVADVRGEFDGPTGTVRFDPARIADTLAVNASIKADTITTRNASRDRDLKSATFFEVLRFPLITFKSKHAAPGAAGHIALVGDLTMHGITREVTLDVDGPTAAVKDLNGQTRIGASATTTVNRREFGLLYNELLEAGGAIVGNDVRITLDIEMTHR